MLDACAFIGALIILCKLTSLSTVASALRAHSDTLLVTTDALVKGAHDAMHAKDAMAVMDVARPTFDEFKGPIVKLWIPALLINLIVVEIWGALGGPISFMTGCDDLCSSIPTYTKLLAPGFWFISNQWVSNFITKSAVSPHTICSGLYLLGLLSERLLVITVCKRCGYAHAW